MTTNPQVNERIWWQFLAPGKNAETDCINLEHRGMTPEQAADYLIAQGADIPTRACSCCGHKVPINGVKVRLVRTFGNVVANVDGEDRWVPASTVEDAWRVYPLSKKAAGGN